MRHFLLLSTVFIFALAPPNLRADGSEVVVIYNSRLPESEAVAQYYARRRAVPENQVWGFAMTTNEEMSRTEFQDSLQIPLVNRLQAAGLWKLGKTSFPATNGLPSHTITGVVASKIRYAVLCWGVPLKIAPDPGWQEADATNLPVPFRRNEASVDSELAWLPLIKMRPPLDGPMPNWTYGTTNADLLTPTNGILLVSRLDGPTPDIARGLVDKALQAERDGLWGRGYFDARGLAHSGDTNYLLGDEWILGAAQIWRQLGFDTIVDDKPEVFPADFPLSQIAFYAGWYAGDVCGPFALPKVEFMPGAFAYHLHSDSAASIRTATRFWVGPLLAKGATCTMGCVYEPYLALTPNIAVFLARWSINQFTFGQAAWAAQPALSWQTTVVGDPLYRPFGTPPQVLHEELADRHSPLIEWSYLRLLNLDLLRGAPPARLINLVQSIGIATNSAVLTEKLARIYQLAGKPDQAIDAYESALRLAPSPEQRIQLRLALAQALLTEHFPEAARRDYQLLLQEAPDYPGRAAIEEKIKTLGEKISATDASPPK